MATPPPSRTPFGSKEELFGEAVDLYGATEGTEILGSLAAARSVREAIAGFLEASARSYTRRGKPAGCLIALGALHVRDPSHEQVCRDLRDRRAQSVDMLRARLQRAVVEGELPEDIDTHAIATFYATVQHGMSIQARDGISRRRLLGVARSAMGCVG